MFAPNLLCHTSAASFSLAIPCPFQTNTEIVIIQVHTEFIEIRKFTVTNMHLATFIRDTKKLTNNIVLINQLSIV